MDIKNILKSIERQNPSIVKYVIAGKKRDEIKTAIKELDKKQNEQQSNREVDNFIACFKKNPIHYSDINSNNYFGLKLNKLCSIEDWQNS